VEGVGAPRKPAGRLPAESPVFRGMVSRRGIGSSFLRQPAGVLRGASRGLEPGRLRRSIDNRLTSFEVETWPGCHPRVAVVDEDTPPETVRTLSNGQIPVAQTRETGTKEAGANQVEFEGDA